MKMLHNVPMSLRVPFLLVCGLAAAGILASSWLLADSGGTGGGPLVGTIHIRVIEEGSDDGTGNPLPVPGAFVMVGLKEGHPFTGNIGYADLNGEITFTDPAITGFQTVTAGATGYRYFSFVDVNASEIVIPLQLRSTVSTASVTGGLTSFSGVNNDGKIQLGLALQAMRMEDLTKGLNIGGLLSPEVSVTFPIAGAVCLPGNVVIPTQYEYLIFKIEKTQFELALPTGTTQQIFCFGAEIGLTTLINLLQAPELDIGALLSALTPLKAGVRRNVYVSGNLTGQNISMANSLNLNFTLNTDHMPSGMNVFLASLGEINGNVSEAPGGGDLLLLGIRSVTGPSGSAVVSTTSATGNFSDMRYLVAAIAANVNDTSAGVTGLLDRSNSAPGSSLTLNTPFLQLVLDPVVEDLFSFSDATQPGISPQPDLNIATLTLTTTVPADPASCGYQTGDTVKVVENLWTLASPGEDLAFYLPILPPEVPAILPFTEQTPADDKLSWSQTAIALSLDPTFNFDAFEMSSIADKLSHFSFNSIDFSYCQDLDGDGYGNPASPACTHPELDCVDDPSSDLPICATCTCGSANCSKCARCINPGAAEVCDGVDNNCDGQIDEEPSASSSCQNGSLCDGQEYCSSGSCHPGTPLNCDDGNVCTNDTCDPVTGCIHTLISCDDGNACTSDTCDPITGCVHTPINCDDGNVCTDDTCNPSTGCLHTNNTASCSDGNACTTNDTCSGGLCVGGPALNCDDGNPCTDDACNPSTGCVHTNNTASCDDGSACTTNDTCSGGTCAGSCNATGQADPCCSNSACLGNPVCQGCTLPGIPSLSNPSNGASNASTAPMLKWATASDATSYDVEVCSDSGCSSVVTSASGLTATQWTVSPALNKSTTYFWRARANNACGSGPWSSTWSFTTGNCFIATAAFGTTMEGKIDELRSFRDAYLTGSPIGEAFVTTYYKYSPPVADYIAQRSWLRAVVRVLLTPVIGFISLFV